MEFRKTTSVPSASGLPDAIYFTQTSSGKFDMYIASQTGVRATLDRVPMEMTVAGTPPASPRYGDIWQDTATDHFFTWQANGQGNYWIDIS